MYVPSLPPRMQQRSSHQSFSHQSFSQHSSSSSSWSSLPAAGPLHPHPTSSAPSTQSHGATRSRLGSKPEGAAVRPRLASLPENSTNRLHPQHTLASFSSSNKVASPTTNGNNLSNLWREEYKRAQHMTIEEMNGLTRSNPKPQFQNPVCVEGITGSQKEGVFMQKAVIKILLRASTYRKGKPDFPPEAVLLHFMAPFWDFRSYSQPYDLREGVKLRVYGTAFAPYSKQKNKSEPSIRVAYYEVVDSSSGSTSSSSQSSPRESRSNTPKVETKPSDQSSLEDNIFKLLLKFDKGTYAKRLSKVYQTEFKVTPPENILELAMAMPFVMIESITATDEMMYMKEEYMKKADQRESQPPSSQPVKPPVVEYLPPPPPLPSTATFTENRLYEVLVCFVTSPFSFYVQIRDNAEQQSMFTEMEKKMNKHFQSSPKKREVALVKENQLYASLWGDGTEGQWCRAMVISVQDSKANVLFPDYGNQEFVSISDLRKLPLQFYQLPFQAIQCCLHGVLMNDNMMSPEANDYFAELAADKVCALHVMDSTGARVSVEILDKQLDDDENINSKLITRFHPIASLSPKLPSPGEPMVAVKLTDVDEVGVLSIQVVGPGLSQLEELTKQIEEKCSTKQTTKIAVGGMYCTEYSLDLCWYRVRVIKEMSSREVLVEYVDYGNEEIIDRMKLRPALDTELFCLPPQIVKCKLHGVPPQEGSWTDSATNYLAQYIDIDELNLRVVDYCIKVTGASSLTLPVVKLYVKNSAHEMVCVNDTVLQEPRLFGLPESLPRPPVDFKTRTSRSVSSAVGSTEEEVVGQRSKTGSSLPSTPREILTLEIASEAGSDTVFGGHLPVDKQQLMSRASSTANSSTRSSPFHALALQARTSYESPSRSDTVSVNSAQIRDENIETLSISSLEDTSRDATEFKASVSDDGKVSPGRPSSAHAKINQHSPTIDMTRLSLVDSPKECIKDGVPYVASPVPGMTVQSCHLAAPSSATRTSPPSSTSLSPSYTKSPSPGPSPAVSSPPITPPMSPPPDPISKCTQTTPSVHGSWVEGERCKWEELPSGKLVEVEVTWAPSPSNFTLLLISNKPKLKLMSEELQRLVAAERYLSPQSSCSGHVCAAKYSMDGLWYRAIISQPFQPHSMQTPVDFLDYGGSELVPLSGLKCLPERCRYLPFQAIKASLYGIGGDVLSPIIVKRFEEMVLMKRLFAIKRTSDSSARVSVMLLDTSDSSGQDIVINEVLSQYILMTK